MNGEDDVDGATNGAPPPRPEVVVYRGVELERQPVIREVGRQHPFDGLRRVFAPMPRDFEPPPNLDMEGSRLMAILCHLSCFFGLPVFLLPLLKRDDAFALHHAKAAAVNFILFAAMLALTFGTCGIFLPAMLLCYVPALVGVVLASSGERAGPFAFGNLGERLFARITVKEDKA